MSKKMLSTFLEAHGYTAEETRQLSGTAVKTSKAASGVGRGRFAQGPLLSVPGSDKWVL